MRGFLLSLALLASTVAGCAPTAATGTEKGWTVTVYYTAVERFHTGERVRVKGCRILDCVRGRDDLGTYPKSFVQAVEDEGTGRITSGRHRGRYLEWSYDVGYWLDDAPRDSDGRALRPYVSAAADPDVLPVQAKVRIAHCGTDREGAVEPRICARLRDARWRVLDEFTPGLGGERHLDVYIGEEDRMGFTEGPAYVTLTDAELRIDRP